MPTDQKPPCSENWPKPDFQPPPDGRPSLPPPGPPLEHSDVFPKPPIVVCPGQAHRPQERR